MPTTYAIPDGRTVMAATTYTGTGASQSISNSVNGVSFKPDLVWIKNRTSAYNHILADSVRGTGVYLSSSTTDPDQSTAQAVQSFNSNGFTIGTIAGGNLSTNAIVGWQWQAGQGTTSSNTSGSITSTVSVNATAGFSVVSFTGLNTGGTAATMGHGLGVAPSFIIIKNRDFVDGWYCYHTSLGNNAYIVLNTTSAQATPTNLWSNTSPTSTVFTLRQGNLNTSTSQNLIAYCWAAVPGYSAFGSYTGNGSTDGPFVYLGFRPRFIMTKRTDSTSDWQILDTSRNTYNVAGSALFPNSSSSETTNGWYDRDFLSNGFKIRASVTEVNASGGTYIYAAFAENPFKYANAR